MAVHDWTLVEPGIFHAFHTAWVAELQSSLNKGLLPSGYYALAEQHAGRTIADVLTLHASPTSEEPLPLLPDTGGIALAEAPPKVRHKQVLDPTAMSRQRTLAIRHVSGHRLVALLEIVSPANKDRSSHLETFVGKIASALETGIHVLLIDLFPPGPHDPCGLHNFVLEDLGHGNAPYDLPQDEPLTLASYLAGPRIEAYLEHLATGAQLPTMPLFLLPQRYVNVPLETTYLAAYQGLPSYWREVLERSDK
jgi:hypothetical protein